MTTEGTPPAGTDTKEVARTYVWAKRVSIIGGVLVGLIGPAMTAYRLAASEAREAAAKVANATVDLAVQTKTDSQATKNEAEAGYQVLLKEVEALRAEKAARERAKPRRHRLARPLPPAPPPRALPTDLKKAEQAVSAGTDTQSSPSALVGDPRRPRPDAGQ